LKNLAHFSSLKNVVQRHHVSHTIHHTHTTKTPHQSVTFSQNPLQKSCFATRKKIIKTAPQNHKKTEIIHLLQSAIP
jgi:hypothetical protein